VNYAFACSVPWTFSLDTLSTATYLLNRRPCRVRSHTTPYELLLGHAPDYAHLQVFWALCYPRIAATTPHKLAPRSVSCVFLGYLAETKGHRCYNPVTHHVITSRHVYFDEPIYPFRSRLPATMPLRPTSAPMKDVLIMPAN
jgi:hypothetical protein